MMKDADAIRTRGSMNKSRSLSVKPAAAGFADDRTLARIAVVEACAPR